MTFGKPFGGLEPYDGKLSRPVLRRACELVTALWAGNRPGLSGDHDTYSQIHTESHITLLMNDFIERENKICPKKQGGSAKQERYACRVN